MLTDCKLATNISEIGLGSDTGTLSITMPSDVGEDHKKLFLLVLIRNSYKATEKVVATCLADNYTTAYLISGDPIYGLTSWRVYIHTGAGLNTISISQNAYARGTTDYTNYSTSALTLESVAVVFRRKISY